MRLQKVQFERFSVLSSRPFETVLAALKTALAQPHIAEFMEAAKGARTFAELEQVVRATLGGKEFMIFMELDEGEILRRENGLDRPKIVRLLIGNPLIMKDMVKHVPDAGSCAPVTVLVDERSNGVHVSYDRMSTLLAGYGNPEALAVASDLDAKIEILVRNCTR